MRVGMRHFWTAQDRPAPRLRVIETLPIAVLLASSVTLVLQAEAGLAYTRAAADSLHAPHLYIDAVMGARPVARNAGAAP
jgi:multicomponent K+:H+ antiporter subunit D